jgi:hypothetical protein
MDEIEVYRSAKLVIDQYGADAPLHAAKQVSAKRDWGDLEGAAAWKRIVWAIADLRAVKGRTKH